MIIERIIYNILAVLFFVYTIKSYITKRKEAYLVVAGGEVVAVTFNVLNLFNGVYYDTRHNFFIYMSGKG